MEILNRALSTAEINAIYAAGAAGKCKGQFNYACSGFEAPFDDAIFLKRNVNRAIPLKIRLSGNGTAITDANIAGAAPVVNVT